MKLPKTTTDMDSKKYIGLIPARYGSSRFPGKPLAMLGGKTVIRRVYEQVLKSLDEAYVCTDDQRIFDHVLGFGGKAVMTSEDCKSGTDRCWQAYERLGKEADVVVNIQGDEPFVQPSQLELLKSCFDDATTQIATLVKPFLPTDGIESLTNTNSPKVVVDNSMRAIYFSRSVIPYVRGQEMQEWMSRHTFYRHIGLYAYRADVLRRITSLPQGTLEQCESLEQLRWIENGYTIRVGVTDVETIGIDTPGDLQRAEKYLKTLKD